MGKKLLNIAVLIVFCVIVMLAAAWAHPHKQVIIAEAVPEMPEFMWKAPFNGTYNKLADINPENVPKLNLGANVGAICEISDAQGFLAYNFWYSDPSAPQSMLVKYDADGHKIWTRDFFDVAPGALLGIAAYGDGQFVVSVGALIEQGNALESLLIKCDADGNILWTLPLAGAVQQLIISESGDIIMLGNWRHSLGASTDIMVGRIKKDGERIYYKRLGGSDFDNFIKAEYDPEMGLILHGYTQSLDGDFALSNPAPAMTYFLAGLDIKDATVKWQLIPDPNSNDRVTDLFAVNRQFVYAIIDNFEHGYGVKGLDSTTYLAKLDASGNQLWKTPLFINQWARALAVLADGRIVVGGSKMSIETVAAASLMWLDQEGNMLSKLEGAEYHVNSIMPTDDGGFITVTTRNIDTVASTYLRSSIPYDTEKVAVKYDEDNQIVWRKTYDNYQGQEKVEMLIPLKNGKILVE